MSEQGTQQDQDTAKCVQLNLASDQRNAARDYHEYSMSGSIEVALATLPKAKLDKIALDNSRMFWHRFGFEPPKIVRKQVLDIQDTYDYNDRDIRSLRFASQLDVGPLEAKLKPNRFFYWYGCLQTGLFSLMSLVWMLQVKLSTAPAWKQGLGELFFAALYFGVFWILNKLYLAPWRLLKRSGALSA